MYNVSLEENARGKEVYAVSNEPIRVGVPLPSDDAVVKFKIVEVTPNLLALIFASYIQIVFSVLPFQIRSL